MCIPHNKHCIIMQRKTTTLQHKHSIKKSYKATTTLLLMKTQSQINSQFFFRSKSILIPHTIKDVHPSQQTLHHHAIEKDNIATLHTYKATTSPLLMKIQSPNQLIVSVWLKIFLFNIEYTFTGTKIEYSYQQKIMYIPHNKHYIIMQREKTTLQHKHCIKKSYKATTTLLLMKTQSPN